MPIKGTSEVRRLTRLGKIHLGIKKESARTGNPYPEATDYFVCPEEVRQIYGEKPTELRIVFPTNDAPQQWLKRYSLTRGLICRGDGEKAMAQVDMETGEIANANSKQTTLKEIICEGKACPAFQAKQCRPVMTLQFLLPDVPGALGVYQIDTSSFYGMVNINSTLELLKNCGRVSMLPLTLRLVSQETQPEGKKQTNYILQLIAPYTLPQLLNLISTAPSEIFKLPAPDEPPEDLFPPEVMEQGVNTPTSLVAAAATSLAPGPAAPPPPGDKKNARKSKSTRSLAGAPPSSGDAPLISPELLKAWLDLRTLQKECVLDDGLIRGGFRKYDHKLTVPKAALTDSPPPWATLAIVNDLVEKLQSYQKSMQKTKELAEHIGEKKSQPGETPGPGTDTEKQPGEVMDK
jgi:hypothetical protein